jgi:DNA-binding PadR family transcriptional regulator
MNPRQLDILRAVAHSPRTLRSFTNGICHVHPNVVVNDLAALEEKGLVEQTSIERYSITHAGQQHLKSLPGPTPPKTWGPLSTTGNYEPKPWTVRAGAEQFLGIRSKGTLT